MKPLKPTSRFFSDVSTLTIGNALALIITLAGYPFITRIYDAATFGEFAIFQSVFLILAHMMTLNYHEALVITKEEGRFKALFTTMLFVIGATLLLLLLFITLQEFELINIQLSPTYLWFLPIAVLLGSIVQLGNFSLLRAVRLRLISIIKVTERFVFQATAILISLFSLSWNGLILAMISGQLVAFVITAFNISTYINIKTPWRYSRKLLLKYRNFPLYSLPGGIVEHISRQLPMLLLPILTSVAITGQYALAYRMLSLPEALIGASIGQVFYQRISQQYHQGKPMKPLIIKTWGLLAIIGIPPLLLLLSFGDDLFRFAFGNNWHEAGQIAEILAVMMFFMLVSTPTSATLSVLNKQHYGLVFGLLLLCTRIGSLYFGIMYVGLHTALWWLAGSEIIAIIIFNIIVLRAVSARENQ